MTEGSKPCPDCGQPVPHGMIICTNCGLNLATGQKLAMETAAGGDPRTAPPAPVRSRRRVIALIAAFVGIGALFGLWRALGPRRPSAAPDSPPSDRSDTAQAPQTVPPPIKLVATGPDAEATWTDESDAALREQLKTCDSLLFGERMALFDEAAAKGSPALARDMRSLGPPGQHVFGAICAFRSEEVRMQLMAKRPRQELLNELSPDRRRHIDEFDVLVLGLLKERGAVPGLIPLLQETIPSADGRPAIRVSPAVRQAAAIVLGRIADPSAARALCKAATTMTNKAGPAFALVALGDAAVAPLAELLEQESADLRHWAALTLGRLASPQADTLIRATLDRGRLHTAVAAIALSSTSPDLATSLIRDARLTRAWSEADYVKVRATMDIPGLEAIDAVSQDNCYIRNDSSPPSILTAAKDPHRLRRKGVLEARTGRPYQVELARRLAAEHDDPDATRFLRNSKGGYDYTCIAQLLEAETPEVAQLLTGEFVASPSATLAMCYAVSAHDRALLRALLDRGADPNVAVAEGEPISPLRLACERNDVESIELLLMKGADPDWGNTGPRPGRIEFSAHGRPLGPIPAPRQWPLLHGAVRTGNVDLARLLLDNGADANLRNQLGATPLMVAVGSRFHAWIKEPDMTAAKAELGLLLSKGADPWRCSLTTNPFQSLRSAMQHTGIPEDGAERDLAAFVVQNARVEQRAICRDTDLSKALERNDADEIRRILGSGLDLAAWRGVTKQIRWERLSRPALDALLEGGVVPTEEDVRPDWHKNLTLYAALLDHLALESSPRLVQRLLNAVIKLDYVPLLVRYLGKHSPSAEDREFLLRCADLAGRPGLRALIDGELNEVLRGFELRFGMYRPDTLRRHRFEGLQEQSRSRADLHGPTRVNRLVVVTTLGGEAMPPTIACAPLWIDENTFLVGGVAGTILMVDAGSLQVRQAARLDLERVMAVSDSPAGVLVVGGRGRGTHVLVLDRTSLALLDTIDVPPSVRFGSRATSASRRSPLVFSLMGDNTVTRLDLTTKQFTRLGAAELGQAYAVGSESLPTQSFDALLDARLSPTGDALFVLTPERITRFALEPRLTPNAVSPDLSVVDGTVPDRALTRPGRGGFSSLFLSTDGLYASVCGDVALKRLFAPEEGRQWHSRRPLLLASDLSTVSYHVNHYQSRIDMAVLPGKDLIVTEIRREPEDDEDLFTFIPHSRQPGRADPTLGLVDGQGVCRGAIGQMDGVKHLSPSPDGSALLVATATHVFRVVPRNEDWTAATSGDRPGVKGSIRLDDLDLTFVPVPDCGLWAADTHVTNQQFQMVMSKPEQAPTEDMEHADLPVVNVTLREAAEFCTRLTVLLCEAGLLPPRTVCHLPDRRTWLQLATCGGYLQPFPWGNEWPPATGNYGTVVGYSDPYPELAPVRRSGPNAWGLYDVADNVRVWTSYVYTRTRKRAKEALVGTRELIDISHRGAFVPEGTCATVAGSCWLSDPWRDIALPPVGYWNEQQIDSPAPETGFRVVLGERLERWKALVHHLHVEDISRRARSGGNVLPKTAAALPRGDTPSAVSADTARGTPKLPIQLAPDMAFVSVQPGTFRMGSAPVAPGTLVREVVTRRVRTRDGRISAVETPRSSRTRPRGDVTLNSRFWMGMYEVTQARYQDVMGINPSIILGERVPVHKITWHNAVEFCRKLTVRERGLRRLPQGYAYRLPTEAEWEYCCRAGTTTEFFSGDDERGVADYAWYRNNGGDKPHQVGQKKPNAWGFHDMHGNVREWCQDWYRQYDPGDVTDPTGPAYGVQRATRGGSFALYTASATRCPERPSDRAKDIGFRVVLARVCQPDEEDVPR